VASLSLFELRLFFSLDRRVMKRGKRISDRGLWIGDCGMRNAAHWPYLPGISSRKFRRETRATRDDCGLRIGDCGLEEPEWSPMVVAPYLSP